MCPSKLACFDGVCKDPCLESKPCGRNAICLVENSLPVRTMVCECLQGYVGNAEVECRLRKFKNNFRNFFQKHFSEFNSFNFLLVIFTAFVKKHFVHNLSVIFCSQIYCTLCVP